MRSFNQLISDLNLLEIPLQGAKYTWISSSDNTTRSKIVRVFISENWGSIYTATSLSTLPKPTSDHLPLLIEFGINSLGPIPFRFCSWWLREGGVADKIKSWWSSFNISGHPGWVLWKKLSLLKSNLKHWRREADSVRKARAIQILLEIETIDIAGEVEDMSEENAMAKDTLLNEFHQIVVLEEEQLRLQSRILWLKAGDANSKFFHRIVKGRRQRNFIKAMKIGNSNLAGDVQIRLGATKYFENFFREDNQDRSFPEALQIPFISAASRELCESDFSEQEIWTAIKSSKGDKTPGPDGFTFHFYKNCWNVIKPDILSFLREIQNRNFIEWCMNNTFIALLPKSDSAIDVKDYRPICLINCGYRIFSKILVVRLKVVINEVISQYQGAYLPKRNILDGILIASECLDSRIREGKSGLVCKLDIEKAFDSLNWNFLLQSLQHMGFGDRFCKWIMVSLHSARISVLINGSPGEIFSHQRGLRQGDSASPYLFLAAMNILSLMISQAEAEGWLHGFKPVLGAIEISHLQFADDTIIFLDSNIKEVCILKNLLRNFELISGLRINFGKISIIPIGYCPNIGDFAEILGYKIESLPFTYLGLPLGAPFKASSIWVPFIEKVENRLAAWRSKTLSRGGRLGVIRSCLTSLPIYFLSLFPMPASIYNQLEKLIRGFLWGINSNRKCFHLVRWYECIKPIWIGGLGIRGFHLMNRALHSKWIWRYSKEGNSLWRKVIYARYGSETGGSFPKMPRTSHGIGLWKHICKEVAFIHENSGYEIGDGSSARFWVDRWCNPRPLKIEAPNIFRVVRRKQTLVKEVVQSRNGQIHINLQFYQLIEYWFMYEVVAVHNFVYNTTLTPSTDDVLLWEGNPDESVGYSVAEAYRVLAEPLLSTIPFQAIWKKHIPLKIQIFVWSAALEKIPTHDFLIQRHIICVDYCPLCINSAESSNHLLLHCSYARKVWQYFYQAFGLDCLMTDLVSNLLAGWSWPVLTRRGRILWKLLAHAVLWSIWLERNSRVFNSIRCEPQKVIQSVCGILFVWSCKMVEFSDFSLQHFQQELNLIAKA